tara:strand:- start:65 stop:565 length:501 start_codon:yes stop_codon:yes gene_type:complete
MALTKVGKEGIAGISNSSDATFLTVTSGEGATFAGTLAVTGVHTVGNNAIYTSENSTTTQNLSSAVLKGYCRFDGTVGSISFAKSFNAASLTDNGTGDYTVGFTNNMNDTVYLFASFDEGGFDVTRYTFISAFATSTYNLKSGYNVSSATQANIGRVGTSIVGDLA